MSQRLMNSKLSLFVRMVLSTAALTTSGCHYNHHDPIACVYDSECDADFYCAEDGVCYKRACTEHASCGPKQYCSKEGQCVTAHGCTLDISCNGADYCDDGVCVDVPDCNVREDCPAGFMCRDGDCVEMTECQTDTECGKDRFCNCEGSCQENTVSTCTCPDDCFLGETCDLAKQQCISQAPDKGECTPETEQADCGASSFCNSHGACQDHDDHTCYALTDCFKGEVCDLDREQCVSESGDSGDSDACSGDEDCGDTTAYFCNTHGECQSQDDHTCYGEGDCFTGETCDLTQNECVSAS